MDSVDEAEASKGPRVPEIAASAKKKPPPETTESRWTRIYVIASFWSIAICLGLPTWLWTTSIPRARLPLDEMLLWADGKACKPSFPLRISVEAPQLQNAEASHLVRLTQHALDDHNEFSAHHLRLQLSDNDVNNSSSFQFSSRDSNTPGIYGKQSTKDSSALKVLLIGDDITSTVRTSMEDHSTTLEIRYPPGQIPSVTSGASALSNVIATELEYIFAEEQAIVDFILMNSASSSLAGQAVPGSGREPRARQNKKLDQETLSRLSNRMTRSLKYATTYHLTFSLISPTALPSSWEIENAIKQYLDPILTPLAMVSEFRVDTQVQLYAKLAPSTPAPEYDEESGVWTLRNEDLSSFINAAEWPLSPSIGAGPTLNFVLYVPSSPNSPLVVKGSRSTSWLIPQWGGVVLLNEHGGFNGTKSLSKEQIRPALLTFSHQLMALMGAPHSPPSFPLQMQSLVRIQALSLLLSASSTMGSLARLTVALPSIAIPETVSSAVDGTLGHLHATCRALKRGQFGNALEHARIAEAQAEKGFFEKSMVGQVYFPDEHKVAVYLPLLGPIGVPLFMSAAKELKRIISALRNRGASR